MYYNTTQPQPYSYPYHQPTTPVQVYPNQPHFQPHQPHFPLPQSNPPHFLPPNMAPPTHSASSKQEDEPVVTVMTSPKCIKLVGLKNECALELSETEQAKLIPPADVIKRNSNLVTAKKAPQLAIKLAKQCYFGDSILVKCTVAGHRKFNALPTQPLNELKQAIFELFPIYHQNPVSFESLWKDCAESIGQYCKRLRLEEQRKLADPVVL